MFWSTSTTAASSGPLRLGGSINGVTVGGPYDGGDQERAQAARYRRWADKVRDDCPRARAVRDGLAEGYEADARREYASAARQAEM